MANEAPPIQVDHLSKSFGEQKVLNGITLQAKAGETLAVLGRSGTGKSVLLKLLIGLQCPDGGSVKVLGQDMAAATSDQLSEVRKKVGYLFQAGALYDSLTVAANVEFPIARHTTMSPQDRQAKVHELLSSVGMEGDTNKMPSEISGGMQKRVGLARALALDPEVLLLDEPTAGLDPITSSEIGKLIQDLKQKHKMTAVVVTHDLRTAKEFADRLVLMHEGSIRVDGSFADLEASQDDFVKQFLANAG